MRGWLKGLQSGRHVCTEHDQHVAAAALMYEVARADGQWQESETDALLHRMSARWQMQPEDAEALLEDARKVAESATDYHELVRSLREWQPEQRRDLVLDMWAVAHADDEVHPHEEYVIRKVADLLYVSHSDFIRGKLMNDKR
ncbi:TerB family tellurite resistance protein [Alcanivorax sp. 1008]|uniref:tellurite resistance TerB family protein n=1 Tax=Alcanivorax sp. 1008 TaxID=2816853 RepID=UPI001DE18C24|nr:TerB family tellurite resistance protein [Alcanivorax sp. 1008]MCC1497968.1 TerB family tellurite resistance protein [Alcanivorax sp. 1008]